LHDVLKRSFYAQFTPILSRGGRQFLLKNWHGPGHGFLKAALAL